MATAENNIVPLPTDQAVSDYRELLIFAEKDGSVSAAYQEFLETGLPVIRCHLDAGVTVYKLNESLAKILFAARKLREGQRGRDELFHGVRLSDREIAKNYRDALTMHFRSILSLLPGATSHTARDAWNRAIRAVRLIWIRLSGRRSLNTPTSRA